MCFCKDKYFGTLADKHIKKYILVSHAINQFAKLFQGCFSATDETIIERKLCDFRVSVVNSYQKSNCCLSLTPYFKFSFL